MMLAQKSSNSGDSAKRGGGMDRHHQRCTKTTLIGQSHKRRVESWKIGLAEIGPLGPLQGVVQLSLSLFHSLYGPLSIKVGGTQKKTLKK